MRFSLFAILLGLIASCSSTPESLLSENTIAVISGVLEDQPEEVKARYQYRHPEETLTFFGIQPGQTVVEVLPGGGWYSKILLPLIGPGGRLIGADYDLAMWPEFGFFDEKFIESRRDWPQKWPDDVTAWAIPGAATVEAFQLGTVPEGLRESVDRVLFIRALHNLAQFEAQGGYLTSALGTVYQMLKPGGIVGIVQHEAKDDMPDDWASGKNGYLKKGQVIMRMQAAGFEFDAELPVNENPLDQPTFRDDVWRLPPSLHTGSEDPEQTAAMQAIGESNRMTLRFRKPLN